MDKLDHLRRVRGEKYGPVEANHKTIGMQWGGILTHAGWIPGEPIPARIVCLLMVALKLNREAYYHQEDNINDGKNYLAFAGEIADVEDKRKEVAICERQGDGDPEAPCGCDWESFGGLAGSPE